MLEKTIALTYLNDQHTDGAAAQLQRIYGIFALSRALQIPYIHTPLLRLDYQGLKQMQIGKPDHEIVGKWNALFHLESDENIQSYPYVLKIPQPEIGFDEKLIEEAKSLGRPTLVKILHPYAILDRFPNFYDVCKSVSPFRIQKKRLDKAPIRVAVHLRRGDLKFADPSRILPNSYYVNTCLAVVRVLKELDLDFVVELHTEVPWKYTIITPGTWSALNVHEDVALSPDDDRLSDFDVIPNLERCYDEPAILTFEKLATAQILIISKSSFSYLAGVLNVQGTVLYHPFWHARMDDWITCNTSGFFDEANLRTRLKESAKTEA